MKLNLFLDDLRKCPPNFALAKNVDEAIKIIKKYEIGIISLDHDLGNLDGKTLSTGYDFVKYFCANGFKCDEIYIHTDNPVGRENMYHTLLGAQRRGFISDEIKIYRYPYRG